MHGIAKEKWERARAKQAGAAEAAGTGGGSGAGGAREAVQSDVKPTVKDEPEKFVKMFLDQRVEIRDVAALGVCLRTKPLDWQQEFLALHGPRVIATALGNISNKRIQAGAFKPIDDKDRELEILKALATIFKDWRGLHYLEEQPQVLSAIAFSLTSPNLAARSLAIEILLIACTTLPHGHAKVISAMTDLNRLYKDKSGAVFGSWLRNLRETLGGRGRMGSLVGLSDELRRNLGSSAMGPAGDAALSDYASDSSLLMRTLQGHPEDIRVRCLIRNQLDEAGAQDIYALLRGFKRPDIDRQIDDMLYERRNDLAELEDVGDLPRVGPLEDPLEVFRGVLASVDGTQARDVFLGSLRSLLLIKPDDDIRLRYHQILNRVVASLVANDAVGMEEFNFSTLTGSNVNQLVGQFEEQERLDRARARAAEMTATAQELALQKAALEEQLALGGAGQTAQLTEKLGATEALLKGSRLATQKLQADMDEMREAYEKRIASLEAKIMELFAMLKEDRQLGGVIAKADGSVDRQQLLDSLERQEEIRKTIEKLEGAHRKQRRRRSGRLPVGRSGFDDDTDEEDATGAGSPDVASAPLAPPVASSSVAGSPASTAPKPPAKSKARRSEVKSGSQFVDAEDEIVREHIEASIVAGLSSSVRISSGALVV
jgi:cytokinesis protein